MPFLKDAALLHRGGVFYPAAWPSRCESRVNTPPHSTLPMTTIGTIQASRMKVVTCVMARRVAGLRAGDRDGLSMIAMA